jgi:hypothetical protein
LECGDLSPLSFSVVKEGGEIQSRDKSPHSKVCQSQPRAAFLTLNKVELTTVLVV